MQVSYRYKYLNLEIRRVENTSRSIHEDISDYSNMLDDTESIEDLKSLFLDFLVATRTNTNLLTSAITSLDEFNNNFLLNGSRLPNEHIKPYFNNEFKKSMIKTRY